MSTGYSGTISIPGSRNCFRIVRISIMNKWRGKNAGTKLKMNFPDREKRLTFFRKGIFYN